MTMSSFFASIHLWRLGPRPCESSTICRQLRWFANPSSDASLDPASAVREETGSQLSTRNCWLWFLHPKDGVIPAFHRGVINISLSLQPLASPVPWNTRQNAFPFEEGSDRLPFGFGRMSWDGHRLLSRTRGMLVTAAKTLCWLSGSWKSSWASPRTGYGRFGLKGLSIFSLGSCSPVSGSVNGSGCAGIKTS